MERVGWVFPKSICVAALAAACALVAVGCTPSRGKLPSKGLTPGIYLGDGMTRGRADPRAMHRGISANGVEFTRRSEGFVPKRYNDAANYCTIAYGHLINYSRCDHCEPKAWRHPGVSVTEGTDLLVEDMRRAELVVVVLSKIELTDGQYAALCDFVFNVGRGNYASATLLTSVNSRDFRDVPYQFRRWTKVGKRALPGVVKRREGEIELFFEGIAEGSEFTRAGATPPLEAHRYSHG